MDRTAPVPAAPSRLPELVLGLAFVAALIGAMLVPIPAASASGGVSTQVSIDDDGRWDATVKRSGYRLDLVLDGPVAFTADERDVATLAAGGELDLIEKTGGVKRRYHVTAGAGGALTRVYQVDGADAPLDAKARDWVAATLLTAFRTTGLDAERRAARLLARGPQPLLDEVAAIDSDHVRGVYLGVALAAPGLDDAALGRALELARGMQSDFELRRALELAIDNPAFTQARVGALLDAARGIESDFELASVLVELAPRLPADAATVLAWRTTAAGFGSDFELRRALEATLAEAPADYRAAALETAVRGMGSDFELRTVLESAAAVIGDDAGLLGLYLDGAAAIGSDFERRQALTTIAPRLSAGSALGQRYLALARELGDYERGQALDALIESRAL